MIPPSDGSPMAEPPWWYDQVIDLSLDEARGLFEMGVEVYEDYASPQVISWYCPFKMPVKRVSEIKGDGLWTVMYYIRKD